MELLRFGALTLLLCLAVAGSDAASSGSVEEYWHSISPQTSMPEYLAYLLGSGMDDVEIKDTQYPDTNFFEDDLQAGKQMDIKFDTHHSNKEQKSDAIEKDLEKSSSNSNEEDQMKLANPLRRWGIGSEKRSTSDDEDLVKLANPLRRWGIGSEKRSISNDEDQVKLANPLRRWGIGSEKTSKSDDEDQVKLSNPILLHWGIGSEKRSTSEDKDQVKLANPLRRWGIGLEKRSTSNDEDQVKLANPLRRWGIGSEKRSTLDDEDLVKPANPLRRWGVGSQKRNTMVNELENASLKAICDVNDKFVGEDGKFCAESVESVLDFVISKLGKNIEALSSSFVPHQTQYKILEGVQKVSSEGVMCHKLEYYRPLFYCHQVNATITYIVPVEAADGTRTHILALCHRDTRGLTSHVLIHQHKVMPGTVPVCHFMGSGSFTVVPRNNELKATY